ncbi:hypothetical protein RHOFW510R12_03510 [Rhodanobacter sp. FW510-R12]|uniref:hypothetical protein n=1 Tax=unclassified Rhodanobacter TaxID=2621553 RepID=UPI0007AA4148|nr:MULTISPECIES: hypothetical protein [unclassified Rhodanobacter]KZC15639.1 hypothetical protein RHOFW104R8_04010 [Rhodanobacter sp. FW104-R8]KZC26220.1 hypothetical protein RhoFW510T8_03620 [Rhodanobacter sp. FW510-T8]KZC32825.1 hypothetical protein RhoFW510R10_10930 [Rhodanobacter sp. FW510-R10]
MSAFPGSPRILKGGIVLIDAGSSAVLRVIALQYNPDSLTRSLQVQAVSADGGDRSEVLRLKGPPVETLKLEAEIDATDQMEFPEQNGVVAESGIFAQLAALETMVYPSSGQLRANDLMAQFGTLEIVPMETPLALFVWSKSRILPVRITEFSITEEAFDTALNPIRAKVSLGLRVLSVNDVPGGHKAASLFMNYLQQKERLAGGAAGQLSALGLSGVP